jgi:hypothetical protein
MELWNKFLFFCFGHSLFLLEMLIIVMCHFADMWVIVDMYIKADFILTSDICNKETHLRLKNCKIN